MVELDLYFHLQATPSNRSWNVLLYCGHLNLAAVVRLASLSRAWVKPMHQAAQTQACIKITDIPRLSIILNSTFDWHESALIELIQLDYRLLRFAAPV